MRSPQFHARKVTLLARVPLGRQQHGIALTSIGHKPCRPHERLAGRSFAPSMLQCIAAPRSCSDFLANEDDFERGAQCQIFLVSSQDDTDLSCLWSCRRRWRRLHSLPGMAGQWQGARQCSLAGPGRHAGTWPGKRHGTGVRIRPASLAAYDLRAPNLLILLGPDNKTCRGLADRQALLAPELSGPAKRSGPGVEGLHAGARCRQQ